jgi:hypothetical protein
MKPRNALNVAVSVRNGAEITRNSVEQRYSKVLRQCFCQGNHAFWQSFLPRSKLLGYQFSSSTHLLFNGQAWH